MNTNSIKQNFVYESMTRIVDHVYVNDSASEAVRLMLESGHTAIPVVNNDLRCVGILSRKDFTEIFFKEDKQLADFFNSEPFEFSSRNTELVETCGDLNVCDLMTHEVKTIPEETTLQEACRIMSKCEVHHLPVVDKDDKLIGIFSSLDAVRFIADQQACEFNS